MDPWLRRSLCGAVAHASLSFLAVGGRWQAQALCVMLSNSGGMD